MLNPYTVISSEDPRIDKEKLDIRDHCWVLVELDPNNSIARVVSWDGGEPEDQILVRDWDWVPKVLNEQHNLFTIQIEYLEKEIEILKEKYE